MHVLQTLLFDGHAFAVLIGVVAGFAAGILPGIGGRLGLALALPFATAFDPLGGVMFLLALHSVVHTSGSITPIAYGLPTSASDAATAIDGFKLQQAGRGSEALGASLTASSVGGIIGALVFILAAPVVRPLVTVMGAPEFLLLSLLGLSFVSILSGSQMAGGLAVAALGVLASSVGLDPLTAVPRFTFDRLELWDGLSMVPLVGGLFVVPEMLSLSRARRAPPSTRPTRAEFREVLRGTASAFRHWVVLIHSTIVGIVVGMMPGAGSSVAVWIAYANAARRSVRDAVPVGAGNLAGVIAPEAANNAKEGGALIPTIYLGIPGSSSMAILISGMVMLGMDPGPHLLQGTGSEVEAFAWTVALANLLTIPLFLAAAPLIVGLTAPRPRVIAPFALVAITTVILAGSPIPFTLEQFAVMSVFGVVLLLAGLPRAPFILGYVMGPIVERSLSRTVEIYGWDALARPGVIVLGVILVLVLFRLKRPSAAPSDEPFSPRAAALAFVIMLVLAAAACIAASSYPGSASFAPIGASLVMAIAAATGLAGLLWRAPAVRPEFDLVMGAAFVAQLAATPLIGLVPATLGFLVAMRTRLGLASTKLLFVALLAVFALQTLFSLGLFDRPLDLGLLGVAIDALQR